MLTRVFAVGRRGCGFIAGMLLVLMLRPAVAADIDVFARGPMPSPNIMLLLDFSKSMNKPLPSGRTRIEALRAVVRSILDDQDYEFNAGLQLFDAGWAGSGPDFPVRPKDQPAAAVDPDIPTTYQVAQALASMVENLGPDADGTPLVPTLYELARYWQGADVDLGEGQAPQWVDRNGDPSPYNGYYPAGSSGQRRAAHPQSYDPQGSANRETRRCYNGCSNSDGSACNTPKPYCSDIPPDQLSGNCGVASNTRQACLNYGQSQSGCVREVDGECLEYGGLSCQQWGPSVTTRKDYCEYRRPLDLYRSPISDACQNNAIVLVSDGAPSLTQDGQLGWRLGGLRRFINALPENGLPDNSALNNAGEVEDYCSDVDNISGADPERVAEIRNAGRCGPELAWLLNKNDLSGLPGEQNVVTYTIGFDLAGEPETKAYLQAIAGSGDGEFYNADSQGDLRKAILDALSDLRTRDRNRSLSSPALSLDNSLQHRDVVYIPMFEPGLGARWAGNVKGYRVDPAEPLLQDARGRNATKDEGDRFLAGAYSLWTDPNGPPDGDQVTAGGMASQLAPRAGPGAASTAAPAYTYTGAAAPAVAVDLRNSADHWLREDNPALTTDLLGLAQDEDARREQLLRWARGIDVLDEDGDGDTADPRLTMGDPLHTRPLVVDYPNGQTVLLVVTNEGFLHAFDASPDNPRELFAFMPQALLGNLEPLLANAPGRDEKVYGLDGKLTVWHHDVDRDQVVDAADGDFLRVYFGMRRGGSSVYALDLTDLDAPRYLWRIDAGSSGFERLGQTWSQPQLVRVKTATGVGPDAFEVLLAFAGGYDAGPADPAAPPLAGDRGQGQDDPAGLAGTRVGDARGNALYLVDPLSGALRWSAGGPAANASPNLTLSAMDYAIASALRAVDVNEDGVTDRFYVGDLGGQLWRVDLTAAVPDRSSDSSDYAAQTLADANAYLLADLAADGADRRRFFYPPAVADTVNDGELELLLAIGSGHRSLATSSVVQDRFFVLRDRNRDGPPDADGDGRPDSNPPAPLAVADLLDVSDNAAPAAADLAAKAGWYLDFDPDGEKTLSSPLLVAGRLLFTTFTPKPPSSAAACLGAVDKSRLYSVDLLSGAPLAGPQAAGVQSAGSALQTGGSPDERFQLLNTETIPDTPYAYYEPLTLSGPRAVGSISLRVGKEPPKARLSNLLRTLLWRPVDPTAGQ